MSEPVEEDRNQTVGSLYLGVEVAAFEAAQEAAKSVLSDPRFRVGAE